jgi:hypothetical protein
MRGVITNSKVGLDDVGNSTCSPKVIVPAMRRRPFRQQLFQPSVVLIGKTPRSTWGRRGQQGGPSALTGERHPAADGHLGDSEGFGNIALPPALLF